MSDAAERSAMRDTVRRAIVDAAATGGDADLVLAHLGWLEMLGEERDDAIAAVFAALGETGASASALDDVLASALGQEPRPDLAVLLPPFASWDPSARAGAQEANEVQGDGLATERAARAADLLVVCGSALEPCAVLVPARAVTSDAVRGVDPSSRLRAVRVQGAASSVLPLEPGAWQAAVALGRRALAHQIEGACRAMLDLARSHALTRVQFGRPIARFQAVRHRLAESLVAVESLEAALTAARDEPRPETAALAKAIAGRAAQAVSRHCQQVLAGVGFTTEHAFHRYAKRVLVLDGLLGSAERIVLDVGRRLLAERRLPTLIEL